MRNLNTTEYWDDIYSNEISQGKIRKDGFMLKILPLLQDKRSILDFGSGPGGNVKLLSEYLHLKKFSLLDHSKIAIEFARKEYLEESDSRGNTFRYFASIAEVKEAKEKYEAIISIEVLEHIKEYHTLLDDLWSLLENGGVLIISVPVKGWRDRHREHINKFTVTSMFETLSKYSTWVHISPRTYSRRSGILATAFFYILKEDPRSPNIR